MSAGQEPENKSHDTQPHVDTKQAILSKLNFRDYYSRFLLSGDAFTSADSEGWTNRVKCPIHEDRTTPNFFINAINGSFKCHACGSGGSVFDFWLVMNGFNKQDKSQFTKALDALGAEVGINPKHHRKHKHPASLPADATKKTSEAPREEIPKHNKADQIDKTTDPIPASVVEEMQKALRRDHFVYLNTRRGLKKKTIDDYCLGFDVDQLWRDPEAPPGKWERGKYSIPVRNKAGEFRNIRMYSPGGDAAYKMLNYTTGKNTPNERKYGPPPRLFNLDKLFTGKFDNIVICEGEWDCLLLNQKFEEAGMLTWLAVTGTHGANTFEAEWLEYLYGKHIYFCFDCDEAGKTAQLGHVNKYFLRGISTGKYLSVRMVELPLDGSKESKDISDYFLKHEFTCEDFLKLCLDTPDTISGGIAGDEGTGAPIEVNDFIAAIKDRRYIDQRITVPISISGTTSKVYHAIRTYAVTKCPVMDKSGSDVECCSTLSTERTIPYGHSLFIEACMERERNILQSIAGIACQHGQKCSISPVTKVVMEEYFAHQVVKRWRSEEDEDGRMKNVQELVQTSVYVLQPEQNIPINPQDYMATGFIRTHPKTGIATFFIEQMIPMEEDWRKFAVESPENQHMLKTLRDEFTVDDILNDLRNGVTQIYEMDEILLSVLLTYLTPLWIHFNGRMERGWVNVAIIGDTGTGKSATYIRFSDWVELGDLFSALSGTRTGLLYSIKKKADEWHVQIGRYVQASGKIIAVDETQETSADDIKRMAVAMDTGYLKVDQVASGGYHSETRTLFLMNPKNYQGEAATISDFTFGCDALRMCFHPMFIRRLDLALFTTGRQTYELYNQEHKQRDKGKIRLTPRMMRTLIYWAWNRTADQIDWTPEATTLCLEMATQLSKDFGDADQVPLVNPQDFRVKLARLSTAFAVLSRSFSEDLEKLIVKPEHVQVVANFIDKIYSMPACNLKHRSKQARSKNSMDDFEAIQKVFEGVIIQAATSGNVNNRQGDYFVRMLLFLHTMHKFRKTDLADQLGVNRDWVNKRVTILQGYNMLEVAQHGGYKTTKKFNLFMQRWLQSPEIAKIFEEVQERVGRQALQQADSVNIEPRNYDQGYQPSSASYYNDDPFTEGPLTGNPHEGR